MSFVIGLPDRSQENADLSPPPAPVRFVARQPMLDVDQQLFAYKLLARQGEADTHCLCADPVAATASVLHEIVTSMPWRKVVGDVPLFVSFTCEALMRRDYQVLSPEALVVDLVDEAEPLPGLDEACRRLKALGYRLAVDSHVDPALLKLADVIRVDLRRVPWDDRLALTDRLRACDAKLLAMKVESYDEFHQAIELGFDYVQGYFFHKPQMLRSLDVGDGRQTLLRLAAALSEPSLNMRQIEQILRGDAGLSYKLLRYLNSVGMNVTEEVTSIGHALRMLGEQPLRRWCWLMTMASLGEDKPRELTVTALVRARFAERIAENGFADLKPSEAFLVGLLSLVEPMTERPVDEVLCDLPLAMEIKAALLGAPTPLGALIDLAAACERCETDGFNEAIERLNLTPADVNRFYHEAIEWSTKIMNAA